MTWQLSKNEETFWRLVSDFMDKCPYCKTNTLSRIPLDTVGASLLLTNPPHNTDIFCTSCNKQMTHLHWRGYGVDWNKRCHRNFPRSDFGISKYDSDRHAPWKETNTPLWAIGD